MTQQQIKMLSIDDRMLTSELDRAGYRNMGIMVRQVSSFAEAEETINSEEIDLIVINLDYEKVDALAICKHFKSDKNYKDIPLVLTSVQTSASVRKSSTAAGADLFVEQPLPRQYFIEKLKKLLDQVTRGNDRIDIKESCKVSWGKENLQFTIGDISSSGMLLNTENAIPSGEQVKLSFMIPGYKKPIEVNGLVVRHIKSDGNAAANISGLGIRFESFLGDSEKRLEKYVVKTSDTDEKMIYYL